jgi:hypothetical protein
LRSVTVLSIGLVLFLTSCSLGIRQQDLIGTYKLETKDGKATLKLSPDGTLEQTVEPHRGMPRTVSGTWKWDRTAGDLILKDAIQIDGDHIGLRADVIMMPAVRTLLGALEVRCDADLECAYRKQ